MDQSEAEMTVDDILNAYARGERRLPPPPGASPERGGWYERRWSLVRNRRYGPYLYWVEQHQGHRRARSLGRLPVDGEKQLSRVPGERAPQRIGVKPTV